MPRHRLEAAAGKDYGVVPGEIAVTNIVGVDDFGIAAPERKERQVVRRCAPRTVDRNAESGQVRPQFLPKFRGHARGSKMSLSALPVRLKTRTDAAMQSPG